MKTEEEVIFLKKLAGIKDLFDLGKGFVLGTKSDTCFELFYHDEKALFRSGDLIRKTKGEFRSEVFITDGAVILKFPDTIPASSGEQRDPDVWRVFSSHGQFLDLADTIGTIKTVEAIPETSTVALESDTGLVTVLLDTVSLQHNLPFEPKSEGWYSIEGDRIFVTNKDGKKAIFNPKTGNMTSFV